MVLLDKLRKVGNTSAGAGCLPTRTATPITNGDVSASASRQSGAVRQPIAPLISTARRYSAGVSTKNAMRSSVQPKSHKRSRRRTTSSPNDRGHDPFLSGAGVRRGEAESASRTAMTSGGRPYFAAVSWLSG
jgi:hypothetical protein